MHVLRTRTKPILDRSSPGSKRTVTGVKAAGHLSKSGIQNPDSTAEQPGQQNVKLLEEQPQKKKWMVTENKEIMMCYFEADPSQVVTGNECTTSGYQNIQTPQSQNRDREN